jgi:6-phosphogluconate dehydrogenase
MVHNGIEYGDMQLIGEAFDMLLRGLGLNADALADNAARIREKEFPRRFRRRCLRN